MLDAPQIVQSEAMHTAVIRFNIPRADIQKVMGPAIGEVFATVAAQGLSPIGPVFSHHFSMNPDTFDFEVGIPVERPIAPAGRVLPAQLPVRRVARTSYHGPYEGLGAAWKEFKEWVTAQGHKQAPDLWESYERGPEAGPDSSTWSTQFNQPLI